MTAEQFQDLLEATPGGVTRSELLRHGILAPELDSLTSTLGKGVAVRLVSGESGRPTTMYFAPMHAPAAQPAIHEVTNSQVIRGRSIALPPPYDKRVKGVREAPILARVGAILNDIGCFNVRIHSGGIPTVGGMRPSKMAGVPDYMTILDGATVWIECKAPGGHLREEQAAFMRAYWHSIAPAIVVVDPEKFAANYLREGRPTCTLDGICDIY